VGHKESERNSGQGRKEIGNIKEEDRKKENIRRKWKKSKRRKGKKEPRFPRMTFI
jgi:hypothetical protein